MLVKLEYDVLLNAVLMGSQQDCVLLVSNEHEIVFVDIDHKANKIACP